MASYKYRALNPRGRALGGTLGAANEHDLQHQLLQAGLTLIEFKPHSENPSLWSRLQPIQTRDLIQLCLNLEQLDRAGVKLAENLRDVAEAASNPRLQTALAQVQQDVTSGAALSDAMAQHKAIFPSLMVALIGAGEATGNLPNAFHELTVHFEWQEKLRTRIARVAAYPLFSLLAMIAVLSLMLGFVVPEVTQFLLSLDVPLPINTVILIKISNIFIQYGWSILAACTLFACLLYTGARQSAELRYKISAMLLRLPLIGNLIRKINLARFMHTFALIFGSGLGMLTAIQTAERTVSNPAISESITVIREQINNGNPLSLAFKLSGEFPGLVQRMIKIGEDGGCLADALKHVASYYERDVQDNIQSAIGAIGPTLTLIAGGLLIWIATAVFVPVYDSLPRLMR